jgi:hypothetical protein
MAQVTNSSTKAQILEAYETLLEQIKQERKESTVLRQELEKKQSLLEKAKSAAQGAATLNLQQIRKALNDQLDEIEEKLAEEQQKYEALRQGATLLQQELQTLHQIKAEAESLEALVAAHRQAKGKLEQEMADRRQSLDAEIEETRTRWAREQEAFDYNLKLKRRNEQDAYNEQKAKLEKELAEKKVVFEKNIAEREQAVAAQEEELKRLRKESEGFDARLNSAVQQAEKAVQERLSREFEYQQKLTTKDLEAELKLRDQMIQSLEGKVKEQQELIAALSTKTDQAGQQVRDIALKAIDKSGVVGVPMERSRGDKE